VRYVSIMSAETFSIAMEDFFRAMRHGRATFGRNPDSGQLSMPQFVLLVPLLDGRARSVRELAEGAGVASPTATRMLDGLVRDGVAVRRPSESDRRCVLVELTPAGRELLAERRRAARARRRSLYERLEPDERADAERILQRLAEVMVAETELTRA
jgi:DNA-binding MarR family transcriptional regulator